jgi:hypothetical protein
MFLASLAAANMTQAHRFASALPEQEYSCHLLLQDCHHPAPAGTATNYLDGEAGNLETKRPG